MIWWLDFQGIYNIKIPCDTNRNNAQFFVWDINQQYHTIFRIIVSFLGRPLWLQIRNVSKRTSSQRWIMLRTHNSIFHPNPLKLTWNPNPKKSWFLDVFPFLRGPFFRWTSLSFSSSPADSLRPSWRRPTNLPHVPCWWWSLHLQSWVPFFWRWRCVLWNQQPSSDI